MNRKVASSVYGLIALMAISRKIIVLDFKEVDAEYVWASAAVILALGVTYWLIAFKPKSLATDLDNRAT